MLTILIAWLSRLGTLHVYNKERAFYLFQFQGKILCTVNCSHCRYVSEPANLEWYSTQVTTPGFDSCQLYCRGCARPIQQTLCSIIVAEVERDSCIIEPEIQTGEKNSRGLCAIVLRCPCSATMVVLFTRSCPQAHGKFRCIEMVYAQPSQGPLI